MPGGVNHLQSKTEPWRLGFVHGAHPLPPPRERVNACTNPAHFIFARSNSSPSTLSTYSFHLTTQNQAPAAHFEPGAHAPPPPRKRANACTNPAHFHFTLLEYTSLHPLCPFFPPYHMKPSPSGSSCAWCTPTPSVSRTRAQIRPISILPCSYIPPFTLSIHLCGHFPSSPRERVHKCLWIFFFLKNNV